MKRSLSLCTILIATVLPCLAGTISPPELLSADTLAVLTLPDLAAARSSLQGCPWNVFWADPAMKPFREKFAAKFTSDFVEPLERELGVRWADCARLGQGQLTLALTDSSGGAANKMRLGVLLLLDSKDGSEALQKQLADLRKKWTDSGKQVRTEKIRDVEFSVLMIRPDELGRTLGKAFSKQASTTKEPENASPGEEKKVEWLLGQSDTLLVAGTSAKDLEKILIRQAGGSVPSLAEQASFAADYSALFRRALGYVWVNLELIMKRTSVTAREQGADQEEGAGADQGGGSQLLGTASEQIVTALGLKSLRSWGASFHRTGRGMFGEMLLRAPASSRAGLLKLIQFEPMEANPPAFVPAEATKFSRFRLDLRQTWNSLENLVQDMNPQLAGLFKMLLETAGKDKDPNFDLRRNLIDNLGNDLIHYEKSQRAPTFAALASPPSLWLVSSPAADQLASALAVLGSSVSPDGAKVKERDFLGRKVYAVNLPGSTDETGKNLPRTLSFAASGGYVALSTDEPMLEEFLRSSANPGKSLREVAGLAEAAEQVGGMGTGMFGYENQRTTMRDTLETMKKEAGSLTKLLSSSPLAGKLKDSQLSDWLDFSLLPDYEKVAKYFHISVWSGGLTPEGFRVRGYSPDSPELTK